MIIIYLNDEEEKKMNRGRCKKKEIENE